MQSEEKLFELVERCVADAVLALEEDAPLPPFAKVLHSDGRLRDIPCLGDDEKTCYEMLLGRLRGEVAMGDIDAVALTARVTIPEHYGAPSPQGIRIQLEERSRRHEKLSAKLLYVPYELLASGDAQKRSVLLHRPIAVGLPYEIYTRET